MIIGKYGTSIFPEKLSICYTFLFQRSLISAPYIFISNYSKIFIHGGKTGFLKQPGLKWVTAGAPILILWQDAWLTSHLTSVYSSEKDGMGWGDFYITIIFEILSLWKLINNYNN